MRANTEIIILPYAAESGRTILQILIEEFTSSKWTCFQSAIAFAKSSGNYEELLIAMSSFLREGGIIEMTFGADIFGGNTKGSEYEAIEMLLSRFQEGQNARLFLYHEKGSRTFHPKIYLFSNETVDRALVIIGSSNWSAGGFHDNIEANVVVELNLDSLEHKACYSQLRTFFSDYWQEAE